MTKENIYNELKKINALAWQDDDLMMQETLFDLQEQLANLLLAVAQDIGNTAIIEICKEFPYLYSMK